MKKILISTIIAILVILLIILTVFLVKTHKEKETLKDSLSKSSNIPNPIDDYANYLSNYGDAIVYSSVDDSILFVEIKDFGEDNQDIIHSVYDGLIKYPSLLSNYKKLITYGHLKTTNEGALIAITEIDISDKNNIHPISEKTYIDYNLYKKLYNTLNDSMSTLNDSINILDSVID